MHKEVHFAFHCHVVDAVKSSSDEIALMSKRTRRQTPQRHAARCLCGKGSTLFVLLDVEVDVICEDFDCAIASIAISLKAPCAMPGSL